MIFINLPLLVNSVYAMLKPANWNLMEKSPNETTANISSYTVIVLCVLANDV